MTVVTMRRPATQPDRQGRRENLPWGFSWQQRRRHVRRGFLQGISLVLPVTLSVMGIAVFTATVAMMQDHFKFLANSEYLVGVLQTMPAFWITVFSPVAGWLADRYGRRLTLIIAMLIHTGAGILPFFLENMSMILTTRCFVGMSESMILICTSTLLCDYFHNKVRDRWLAAQTGTATFSSLLIIWIGGVLGAKFGWKGPFLIYLSTLPLVAAVVAFTWEPVHDRAKAGKASDADARYRTLPWARLSGIAAITVLGSISRSLRICTPAGCVIGRFLPISA